MEALFATNTNISDTTSANTAAGTSTSTSTSTGTGTSTSAGTSDRACTSARTHAGARTGSIAGASGVIHLFEPPLCVHCQVHSEEPVGEILQPPQPDAPLPAARHKGFKWLCDRSAIGEP